MKAASSIVSRARREGRKSLNAAEAKEVMSSYGIRCAKGKVAKTPGEAAKVSRAFGKPVAMKILSSDILHKSDAKCVFLNVEPGDVEQAFKKIIGNAKKRGGRVKIDGVLVEEMVPLSSELMVGMKKDPTFGPAIAFGWGGIFVELLKKVNFRISPLSKADIDEIVDELEGIEILKGARGTQKKDLEAVKGIIRKVDRIAQELDIMEIDLNPIFIYAKGALVVDARVVL